MSDAARARADVAEALAHGTLVVALESTLIAHGLPRPDNLDLARANKQILRHNDRLAVQIARAIAALSAEPDS